FLCPWPGLVDPLVKGPRKVAQGPVVLEVGRLVQEPGRRPPQPAVCLEVVLAVQESVEERVGPAPGLQVLGDLPRGRDERPAIRLPKSLVGPVAAVVVALHRAGPVLMQGEIEAFDGDALAWQVRESRP